MRVIAVALVGLVLCGEARLRMRPRPKKGKNPKGKDPKAPPPPLRTTTEEDYWKQWEDFRDMSGKKYLTQSHHDDRFEIFKDNIDKINRHNAKKLSWEMGVTPFADMTADEFKSEIVGGCTLERKANKVKVFRDVSSNPTAVDWTTQGKVTDVKNQGQCGSCWAFSTTGAVESRYAIKYGTLTPLSEQELVDCAGSEGNNGCRGGLMDYGFEYVEKEHGLCTETAFPYDAKTEKLQCNSKRSACTHMDPITGYKDVQKNSSDQLETALTQGPVSIAIEADQSAFQLYKKGILSGRCGTKLDHGVLAVGYSNEGQDHFWKVKNSWGPNWGEDGYIRLCKDCNANRGAGECGLLGQPSYPTV